jgi:hypothetical protein
MNIPARVAQKVGAAGGSVWIKKTITSSNITTVAKDLTSGSFGSKELFVRQIILKTDATGLAGGTNFVISSTNAKGTVNIAVETVANLGANVTKALLGVSPAGDTTTSDAGFTVTAAPTILEAGKKLQYSMTSSVGTGAGTIDVYVELSKVLSNIGDPIQAA